MNAKRPLTDLEAEILEVYRQLSPAQKKMALLSAMLSAAANSKEAIQPLGGKVARA